MAIDYAGQLPKQRAPQWEEISYMTTPAKRRERTHQMMVKKRRAQVYNPNAPAKVRERRQNQKAKRRRMEYRGTPTAPIDYGPIDLLDT